MRTPTIRSVLIAVLLTLATAPLAATASAVYRPGPEEWPTEEVDDSQPVEATEYRIEAPQGPDGPGYTPLDGDWSRLRMCESSDDYSADTGNGYYGAYQFSPVTWWWLGYEGYPNEAPPEVQDEAAVALWHIYGWSPWPACSWYLGLW